MQAVISGSQLQGNVVAISSKSYCHRHILAAALARQRVKLCGVGVSDDINVSIDMIRSMGVIAHHDGDILYIDSSSPFRSNIDVNMRECGTTLRFALPIIAALGLNANVSGEGRLPDRTIKPMVELLVSQGEVMSGDRLPLAMSGRIKAGEYRIAGNISSQFISGLLMALPLLSGDSSIILTTPLESRQYVDMTIEVLACYGIVIMTTENGYSISGGQKYQQCGDICIETDWSNASAILALGAVHGNISLQGLSVSSLQGDRVIMDCLRDMGADIIVSGDTIAMIKSHLVAIDFSVKDCPDLAPMIAYLMANASGVSRIFDVERLIIKESNRLQAIIDTLRRANINSYYDDSNRSIVIEGGKLVPAVFDSYNDHRIVMLASCIALTACGESIVEGCQAINKSYPDFYDVLRRLSANVTVR